MPRRQPPSALFLVLLLPFGVSSGYVSVTLGFVLAKAGLHTAAVAALVALSVWPQTWKVFWAPLVDTALPAKVWYCLGATSVAASIVLMGVIPAPARAMPLLGLLVVVSSVASTFVSMASEVFMAHGTADERKGAVSGWSQAGNLGGVGLGGGLGLYLSQHVAAPWVSGAGLAVLCVACCAALPFVDEPSADHRKPRYLASLGQVARDAWGVARSRAGFLVLVLMVLPIGSGGAQQLWSAVAGDWAAGADTVALVNGLLGGIASIFGAVAAGFALDRLDRRTAYCGFGLALAAVAAAMALAPRTPVMFVVFTLLYAAVLSASYAAYSAAVLEAIGKGAAATKFNLLAAISNIPIAVMTGVDGRLHDKGGANAMLYGEAGVAVVAVLGFALFAEATRNRSRPRDYALFIKGAVSSAPSDAL
jgi:predicted MFS family arabinose efflux permease